ncbi:MAG: hypothetical protein ABID45_01690 [Patescibacteria group bacterium]
MEVDIHKIKYLIIPIFLLPLLFFIDWRSEDIEEQVVEEEKGYLEIVAESDDQTRDVRRITDIQNIQAALELYYMDNSAYPEKLEVVVEQGYLPIIPRDPDPEESQYVYTPIGALPSNYYDLSFELEEGIAGYKKGRNIVNP